MSNPLPTYVRTFRKRQGFTQEDLSFLLDCADGSEVCRLERHRKKPSARILVAGELIFGVHSRELFPLFHSRVEEGVIDRASYLYRILLRRERSSRVERKLASLRAIVGPPSLRTRV